MPEHEKSTSSSAAADPHALAEVRARRAGLRRAMTDAEVAAAGALAGRPENWRSGVLPCLEALLDAWERHITATEADDGLFAQIRTDAPRLAPALARLHREHDRLLTDIKDNLATVHAGADEQSLQLVRADLIPLLAKLARHRQQGSDLLYAAYQVDIGGE